jgi:hypothetical protein
MMEEVAVSNVNVEVFIDSLGAAGAATGADAGFAGAGVTDVVTTAVVVCRSPVSATLCCVCLRHRNKTAIVVAVLKSGLMIGCVLRKRDQKGQVRSKKGGES